MAVRDLSRPIQLIGGPNAAAYNAKGCVFEPRDRN